MCARARRRLSFFGFAYLWRLQGDGTRDVVLDTGGIANRECIFLSFFATKKKASANRPTYAHPVDGDILMEQIAGCTWPSRQVEKERKKKRSHNIAKDYRPIQALVLWLVAGRAIASLCCENHETKRENRKKKEDASACARVARILPMQKRAHCGPCSFPSFLIVNTVAGK